jgi:hypothetical protein
VILALLINCRLSNYRIVIMGFSYKLDNYEKCSKHCVISSRHEIKSKAYAHAVNETLAMHLKSFETYVGCS